MSTITVPKSYSASSISTFESCEKKYDFEYVQLFRKAVKSLGLKTGIIMHEGQEMYWRQHNLEAVIDSVEQEVKSNGWDDDPLFLPKIRAYLKGYYHRWGEADRIRMEEYGLKVLAVEEEFAHLVHYPGLDEPVKHVGKVDLILDDGDYIIIGEHKNVSSKDAQNPTSVFWQSLEMNNLLTLYCDWARKKFARDDRMGVKFLYDVVITSPATNPKLVKKKRETTEEFEERLTALYRDAPDRFVR